MTSKPPKITILPDEAHGCVMEDVGKVLEFEVDADDNALRAKIEWEELASFRNARTRTRTDWFPVEQLEPIEGEDYTGVPRTPIEQAGETAETPDLPPNWPPGLPGPHQDGWQKAALAWLYDHVPPDYRRHAVLAEHPLALTWMARLHLRNNYRALIRGYRSSAVDLKKDLPPHSLAELHEVYRLERERMIRCGQAIDAIEHAWRGEDYSKVLRVRAIDS